MEAINKQPPKSDPGASGSGSWRLHVGRDPDAPPLDRIVSGQHYKLLDLAWADDQPLEPTSCRKTAWPLWSGALIAPPAPAPHEKGKERLRPLSGDADFAVKRLSTHVFRLTIERLGGPAGRYYCNLAEPKNKHGWRCSYWTEQEAQACLRPWGDSKPGRQTPAAMIPWEPSTQPTRSSLFGPWSMAGAMPLGFGAGGSSPSGYPYAESGPAWGTVVTHRAVSPAAPATFTAEEARRRLRALRNILPPRHEVIWGAHRGSDLLAVARTPRVGWGRWRQRERLWNYQIHHVCLHNPWQRPVKAQVVNGGVCPPTQPGQSVTVKTCGESSVVDEWTVVWSIADDGSTLATINEDQATMVGDLAYQGG